jgi:hypothetical protein
MNPRLVVGLILMGGCLVAVGRTDVHAEPLSISISTPNPTVVGGSHVRVNIVVENTSDNPIRVSQVVAEDQAELDFDVVVRKQGDGEPTETKWGRRVHGKDAGDGHTVLSIVAGDLPPGGIMRETTFLDRIYDLTSPGKYTVRVEKRGLDHRVLGKSNVLSITVEK